MKILHENSEYNYNYFRFEAAFYLSIYLANMTSWVRKPVHTANKTMGDSKIKFILIYGAVDNDKIYLTST